MGVPCIVESDHNPLVCTLKIKWDNRIKIARKEVFKLKDTEGLIRFNEITSNCPKLIQISNNSPNFSEDAEKWMKKIQEIMHQSFKKVRIIGKGRPQNTELDGLMKAKQDLRSKLGKAPPSVENRIKDNIDKIEEEIYKICSDRNSKIVKDHISELSNEEGHVFRPNMWRLKQKLCPKNNDPPMAKKDVNGKLISNPEKLRLLYLETYKQRLRHREIQPDYKELEILKNYLFNIRLSLSKTRKSKPWSKQQLYKVLKSLKPGKSCDALGYSNELFKPGVIGSDLVVSLLNIINRAKYELVIPRPIRLTKITSIYKNKGEKCDLQNDRGVHSVTKFRGIIDKLLYNDKYIQFYDITQCFDSMWYEETMNDMWDSLTIRDDKFALISEMNREVDLFVKTPVGDTEIFTVDKIEQQGTVLAPLKCSNQMDSIPREFLSKKHRHV